MKLSEKIKELDFKGRDFPIIAGTVKFKLHNVHNGKDEVVEEHNMATNALKDIFTNNYGGLINYQNFASLYNTWLGGVLLFQNQLDLTSADDYFIPDSTTNPIKAHAGQTPFTDQADDLTRGNPDSSGTVLAVDSTKLRWEWGTSAGNGTIASLGLTHTDTGSYGTGINSTAQKSLNPFAGIGCISRGGSYADNANTAMEVNGNMAYNFYMTNTTTVHIYKTPINVTKFKLQGEALLPVSAYTQMVTATLPNAYRTNASCYFHFDFANNKLILFGVPGNHQTTLYQDVIDLTDGTVTHKAITSQAPLWGFHTSTTSGYGTGNNMLAPTRAIIHNNYLYVYGSEYIASYNGYHLTKMYRINLTDNTDQVEIDTSLFSNWFDGDGTCATANPVATLGDLIIQQSYIINSDVMYPLSISRRGRNNIYGYALQNSVSSPMFNTSDSLNTIYACKLYLATKFNLPSAVTKTSAQSMTVEYQLSEV